MRQVAADDDVTIELKLTNLGPGDVRITANPRFGHRTLESARRAEVEFQLVDSRGRLILDGCTDCGGRQDPEKVVLPAANSRVFTLSLDPNCYNLIPGERLSFIATYANIFASMVFREDVGTLPDVQPSGWLEVVVPSGWRGIGDGEPPDEALETSGRLRAGP